MKNHEIRFVVYHYPDRIPDEHLAMLKNDSTTELLRRVAIDTKDCGYRVTLSRWIENKIESDGINFEPPRTFFSRYATLDVF